MEDYILDPARTDKSVTSSKCLCQPTHPDAALDLLLLLRGHQVQLVEDDAVGKGDLLNCCYSCGAVGRGECVRVPLSG
jgi:hypothetical protein